MYCQKNKMQCGEVSLDYWFIWTINQMCWNYKTLYQKEKLCLNQFDSFHVDNTLTLLLIVKMVKKKNQSKLKWAILEILKITFSNYVAAVA